METVGWSDLTATCLACPPLPPRKRTNCQNKTAWYPHQSVVGTGDDVHQPDGEARERQQNTCDRVVSKQGPGADYRKGDRDDEDSDDVRASRQGARFGARRLEAVAKRKEC